MGVELTLVDLRPVTFDGPTPLSNPEVEFNLIGTILADPEALQLIDGLRPDHFSEPFAKAMFEEAVRVVESGRTLDAMLMAERTEGWVAREQAGGRAWLFALTADSPPTTGAPAMAQMVRDCALRRGLMSAAREITQLALSGSDAAVDQFSRAERLIAELAHEGATPTAWHTPGEVVGPALRLSRASKGLPGLSTGLADLDAITGGWRRGQLAVVAGRPSMGKSTAGLQFVKAAAQSGRGAIFFSMEMPPADLGLRLACDLAYDAYAPYINGRKDNPCYFDAAKGDLHPSHWQMLEQSERAVSDWPVAFDVRPGLTVSQMLAASRRKFREWERQKVEPGLIVVDHLTIVRPEQNRQGSKVAEVGDISRGLAEMSKILDVPVVALCQLSRAVEGRGSDKRPSLSDLRWSGEIEQDARLVAFLYRPEYYLRRPEDATDEDAMTEWRSKLDKVRHRLWWLIEKSNNGPTGEVETHCDIACSAIRDRMGGAA